MTRPLSAGDVLPGDSHVIEVRVSELRQLFNATDPPAARSGARHDADARRGRILAQDIQEDPHHGNAVEPA